MGSKENDVRNKNDRPPLTAKCIYIAIAALLLVTVVVAVICIVREEVSPRGSAGPLSSEQKGPAGD
jgi:hypothetical protein